MSENVISIETVVTRETTKGTHVSTADNPEAALGCIMGEYRLDRADVIRLLDEMER